MKPKACINCNKTIWTEILDPEKDTRSKIEKAFDGYCKRCKSVAQRTSNAITRKRKENMAEMLDREEIRRQREWL